MKKSALTMCCALAVLPVANLHANGGGYFRGGVEKAGDIAGFEPKATRNIRMLDEQLTILVGHKEAGVEIRYLMRNETDRKVKVRFGFPVEESFSRSAMIPLDAEPKESKRQDKLSYCKDYQLTANGKTIATKWQTEKKPASDRHFEGIAGWMVSTVTFGPGEEKPLRIQFRSSYPAEVWGVSNTSSTSPAVFRYRLSTAACWAGAIARGKITLKPSGIPADELKVLKPVNRFKRDGDNWIWDFEDLEPTLADDLAIQANPGRRSITQAIDEEGGPEARYIERGKQWTMEHANYDITASSTLPPDGKNHYDAEQVKKLWGEDTAWSESAKGLGQGEWLELEPKAPKPLTGILIVPGYAKTPELFKANCRPKKVLVELNGEHRYHAQIPDSPDTCTIQVNGYDKPVKCIRLTFEEVWPGEKYEDLCVTRIQLQARLDKKPKIQPVR